jgi:TRAP-type C4-dicarboxylate transport system substrate-binding protein
VYAYEKAKEADQNLVNTFTRQGVKVVNMTPEQTAMWRKIADESSYKNFSDNVPGGRELLDMALSVE